MYTVLCEWYFASSLLKSFSSNITGNNRTIILDIYFSYYYIFVYAFLTSVNINWK